MYSKFICFSFIVLNATAMVNLHQPMNSADQQRFSERQMLVTLQDLEERCMRLEKEKAEALSSIQLVEEANTK